MTLPYEGVGVRNDKNKKRCYVIINTNESYYHDMIMKTCKIGGMYENQLERKKLDTENKEKALLDIIQKKYSINEELDFDMLIEDGFEAEVLDALQWILDRYNFSVEFIQKYENSHVLSKMQFSSMLDEL